MKAKISITLDVELVKWLDDQVKQGVFKNRSQGINHIMAENAKSG